MLMNMEGRFPPHSRFRLPLLSLRLYFPPHMLQMSLVQLPVNTQIRVLLVRLFPFSFRVSSEEFGNDRSGIIGISEHVEVCQVVLQCASHVVAREIGQLKGQRGFRRALPWNDQFPSTFRFPFDRLRVVLTFVENGFAYTSAVLFSRCSRVRILNISTHLVLIKALAAVVIETSG